MLITLFDIKYKLINLNSNQNSIKSICALLHNMREHLTIINMLIGWV